MSDYQPPQQHTTVVVQQQPQSQALPALVSFFLPGVGQLIQGRPIAFFAWIAIGIAGFCLMIMSFGILFLLPPFLGLLCVLDAACWQPGKRSLVGTIAACIAGMVLLVGIIVAMTITTAVVVALPEAVESARESAREMQAEVETKTVIAPIKDSYSAPSDELAEFQTGMKNFIEEAKSMAQAMDLLPDQSSYKKRIEDVQEAYSRIPNPPVGDETLVLCHKSARQITVNFNAGSLFLKFINDFLRLNSKEGADDCVKNFRDLAAKQKTDLDELESAINEHRAPKVELSDVTDGKEPLVDEPKPKNVRPQPLVDEPKPITSKYPLRTWEDATGGFSIQAAFSSFGNSVVSLKKEDGSIIKVPLEKLSEADRVYIEELRR